MAAFSKTRTTQIKTVISRMQTRLINAHKADFTSDEMLELYTRPEDRDVLTRVFELVNLGKMDAAEWSHPITIGDVTAALKINIAFGEGDTKWMVPRYAMHGPQLDSDSPLRTKFDKWMERRVAVGVECATMMALFDELNWRCGASELKFYMPSIIDFLDLIEGDYRIAEQRDKLSNAKTPSLQQLPLGMEEALAGMRTAVAKARMLDKRAEKASTDKVQFTLDTSAKGVMSPWGTSLVLV